MELLKTGGNRDFKGVWIPKNIWLDKNLTALDKIILTEIDSLSSEEQGCYASNEYIAEFCQCSQSKVSHSISKLIELGYLCQKAFNGRQRELQVCLAKNASLPCKKCKSALQKMQHNNIDNNIDNNNNKENNIKEKKNSNSDFERFWEAYPKKKAKEYARRAFQAATKRGINIDILITAINKQKQTEQWKKDKGKYIPYPATWLNGGCWNDEETIDSTTKYELKEGESL